MKQLQRKIVEKLIRKKQFYRQKSILEVNTTFRERNTQVAIFCRQKSYILFLSYQRVFQYIKDQYQHQDSVNKLSTLFEISAQKQHESDIQYSGRGLSHQSPSSNNLYEEAAKKGLEVPGQKDLYQTQKLSQIYKQRKFIEAASLRNQPIANQKPSKQMCTSLDSGSLLQDDLKKSLAIQTHLDENNYMIRKGRPPRPATAERKKSSRINANSRNDYQTRIPPNLNLQANPLSKSFQALTKAVSHHELREGSRNDGPQDLTLVAFQQSILPKKGLYTQSSDKHAASTQACCPTNATSAKNLFHMYNSRTSLDNKLSNQKEVSPDINSEYFDQINRSCLQKRPPLTSTNKRIEGIQGHRSYGQTHKPEDKSGTDTGYGKSRFGQNRQAKLAVAIPNLTIDETNSNSSPVRMAPKHSGLGQSPQLNLKGRQNQFVINRADFNVSQELPSTHKQQSSLNIIR